MARYHNEFRFNGEINPQLFNNIHAYMLEQGYEFRNYKGEDVYKKGMGLAAGPTFMKIAVNGNTMVVEAWVKFAILPGVYTGETGLDGLAGAIPKSALKNRVNTVEGMIQSYGGASVTGGYAPDFGQTQAQQSQQTQQSQQAQSNQGQGGFVFCTNCGTKMSVNDDFCSNCGNRLQK